MRSPEAFESQGIICDGEKKRLYYASELYGYARQCSARNRNGAHLRSLGTLYGDWRQFADEQDAIIIVNKAATRVPER